MKLVFLLLSLMFVGGTLEAKVPSFHTLEKRYKESYFPGFDPYVGMALPGRCFYINNPKKAVATSVLVSLGFDGYELAVLLSHPSPEALFDTLPMEDILLKYPQVNAFFQPVIGTETEVLIRRFAKNKEYLGKIREDATAILIQDSADNKIFRHCFYKKP